MYIIQSTNENAVLQTSLISQSELHYVQYAGFEIFQEQSHFSGSQAAQLSHLSHLVKMRLILSRFRKKTLEDKINKNKLSGYRLHTFLSF